MKLMKMMPVMATVALLVACSQSKPSTGASVKRVVVPATTQKNVVYQCQQNQKLTVSYLFTDKQATVANVTLNEEYLSKLKRNPSSEFTTFSSQDYVWNADDGLTLDTVLKTDGVMLYKKGNTSDQILAKNCTIDMNASLMLAK